MMNVRYSGLRMADRMKRQFICPHCGHSSPSPLARCITLNITPAHSLVCADVRIWMQIIPCYPLCRCRIPPHCSQSKSSSARPGLGSRQQSNKKPPSPYHCCSLPFPRLSPPPSSHCEPRCGQGARARPCSLLHRRHWIASTRFAGSSSRWCRRTQTCLSGI
jgi:hypothetical protein